MQRDTVMIDYVCLGTNDIEAAGGFYDAVLGALGMWRHTASEASVADGWIGWGLGSPGSIEKVSVWLCRPFDGLLASCGNGTMLALRAATWQAVDDFHLAALANGGRCEGAPGLRPQYHSDFYAAYVRDCDGNKVAAVCRGVTEPRSQR